MLVSKYNPQVFADVICRDKIIEDIKKQIASPDGIPHILFYGTPGTGKTTIAHVIGNELYGDKKSSFFYEINASSDRGIDVIREKVTDICKITKMGHPYKIIFMDEADYLTPEAQACFRRLIETYNKTTRFIFACNQVYKLIPAILSRFVKYEVSGFDPIAIAKRLKKISIAENLGFDDKKLVAIAKKSNGDIRSALNMMEGNNTQENETWDSMTWEKLIGMSKDDRFALAFNGDADMIYNKVWDLIQEKKAWNNIDLMANCQSSMNYAAIKNVFIAQMLGGLK